jgi:hypothetical protein
VPKANAEVSDAGEPTSGFAGSGDWEVVGDRTNQDLRAKWR